MRMPHAMPCTQAFFTGALVSSLMPAVPSRKPPPTSRVLNVDFFMLLLPFAAQARHGALAPEFISLLEHAFETSLVELLWSTKVNLWKSWSPFLQLPGSRFLLQRNHAGEFSTCRLELRRSALLGNHAILEHDDLVGIFHRAHAMGDHNDRFAGEQT